jgi:hypothetical protein
MTELRRCTVKGNNAWFHRWCDKSRIVPPSPMIGGHGGGVIRDTVAIVEHDDGTIHEYYPTEVKFIDGNNKETNECIRLYGDDLVLKRMREYQTGKGGL